MDKQRAAGELDAKHHRLIPLFARELSQLKGNLLSVTQGRRPRTLLITSSKSYEGKTLSALNIAHTLASSEHSKVLLIDVNSRAPCLHTLFNLPASPGLSDSLMNRQSALTYCQTTEFANLSVLSYGSQSCSASDMFESEHFIETLRLLASEYSYLVVDADSILSASEVLLICPHFDGILMVIECESTKWEVAKITADKIKSAGGKLIGTIMNRRKFYIPKFFYG